MVQASRRRPHADRGQGLAEDPLLLGLIAVVAITALAFLGTSVSDVLSVVSAAV